MTKRMAVTMGDASGVGPEILLRRYAEGQLGDDCVVYGDSAILTSGARMLGLNVQVASIEQPEQTVSQQLNVVDLGLLSADDLTPGKLNTKAGQAAREYVARATHDALAGRVAGIVTLPMNKEATQATDPDFIGHTEFIAGLCGVSNISMMLTTSQVAVAHVSAHVSLARAIELVQPERIRNVIDLIHGALARFISAPRIAVCGLNPHAGEHGLFGDEDEQIIRPVIEAAVADGMNVSGPHPADTVFYQAIHNDAHDGIICMYHDQGHAPMKLIGFESGVNVTVGLPIIRTSVDHGTAFDIAWQGVAFTSSLQHALDYAWKLAGRQ